MHRDTPGPHEAPARERIPTYLSPMDRCDQCGARAYAAAEVAGVDLLFCGHHFTRHEDRLREIAAEILDERWSAA